jgi:hypothetical protein
MTPPADVLVVGAGPTGLALALYRSGGPDNGGLATRLRLAGSPANDFSRARWVPVVAGSLAVVAVVGSVQQIARVGHAGAKATWHGVVSTASTSGHGDD